MDKFKNFGLNRVGWMESLRAFAMLMVVVPHFIAMFCPEYFGLWHTHSFFLKGINGKHGVVVFCVLTGFFSSRKSHLSTPTYLVNRYLKFSINILLVLLPFVMIHSLLSDSQTVGMPESALNAVIESFLFRSEINPTLWCVKDLFYGNLICFVIGNHFEMQNKRKELVLLLAICLFLYFANVWVSICVLGAALRLFTEIKISDKFQQTLCVVSALAIPFLYRHEESRMVFFMQGISCCLFMYVFMYVCRVPFLKKMPKLSILPFLGNISFYMFLWHTPINIVIKLLDLNCMMWVLFVLSFSVTILLSVLQYLINNKCVVPMCGKISLGSKEVSNGKI